MENGDQWEKIKELFGAALEREPNQRSTFLRDACGPNEGLRGEIESLLLAHEKSGDLSQHPWRDQFLGDAQDLKSIGPYQLIKKLGEGGMGQVRLAEQTDPVRRQVALKLIRAGIYNA